MMLELVKIMERYTTKHLVGISPENFEGNVREFTKQNDAGVEGYEDASRQRDLSVKFVWGHNHDFGSFDISGLMRTRHIEIIESFIAAGDLPRDLTGKRVLDVGCWTGGTSLLLVGLGAEVVAIEEVQKYARVVRFLAASFGIQDQLSVRSMSLYDIAFDQDEEELLESFDFVLFSGVLYHVTDPILALRLLFTTLKDSGTILVETQFDSDERQIWRYAGPSQSFGKEGARVGWNWFTPSRTALSRVLEDVGFSDVKITPWRNDRIFATARRSEHVDMLRAGLSNRRVR